MVDSVAGLRQIISDISAASADDDDNSPAPATVTGGLATVNYFSLSVSVYVCLSV